LDSYSQLLSNNPKLFTGGDEQQQDKSAGMTFRYDYAASWGWFHTLNIFAEKKVWMHDTILKMDAQHILTQLTYLIDESKNS
jgi:hypothetical protein